VIVEYLDWRAGGGALIPSQPEARFATLTAAALADGILDAAILQVYERRFRPPELRLERWLDYQSDKVARGLAAFAAAPPSGRRDTAHIAFACALGYLDLRLAGAWRAEHPALVVGLDAFAADVALRGDAPSEVIINAGADRRKKQAGTGTVARTAEEAARAVVAEEIFDFDRKIPR
jgi:glutathione S-transferase